MGLSSATLDRRSTRTLQSTLLGKNVAKGTKVQTQGLGLNFRLPLDRSGTQLQALSCTDQSVCMIYKPGADKARLIQPEKKVQFLIFFG